MLFIQTRRVRENASPWKVKMSRDAIRQILAREFLQGITRQNLAYCVSAPDSLFGLFGI
jgi:hypothetical protein